MDKPSMSKYRNKYNGFILMNKPVGISSHDVIYKLRKIVQQKKIGHTGTLDVLADGLMIVCFGKATKASQFVLDLDKSYRAKITLGLSTQTFDAEGLDPEAKPAALTGITKTKIKKVLEKYVGQFDQKVPIYSAVRVKGERLYKLARKGIEVDLPVRTVNIKSIDLLSYDKPTLEIDVACGSGTYIRSLANDIGEQLGCGAYLSGLTRTRIGEQTIDDAFSFDEIEHLHTRKKLELFVLNYSQVLEYASVRVPASLNHKVTSGKAIFSREILETDGEFEVGSKIIIKDIAGKVMAVGEAEQSSADIKSQAESRKLFKYLRVLH